MHQRCCSVLSCMLNVVGALQLSAKDVDVGVLRATPSRLVLLRSWKVDLKRISFRLDGSAGVTYQGQSLHALLHTGPADRLLGDRL